MRNAQNKNRLSPPLMYAFRAAHAAKDARKPLDLRDDQGERVIAGRRAAGRFPITQQALRNEVTRDLTQLLNAINLESTVSLDGVEEVRASVLNYGMPDLVHRTLDDLTPGELETEVQRALRKFEPRLVDETVAVIRDASVGTETLRLRYVVKADLACDPVAIPVQFAAEVEADTGKIVVTRL